MTELGELPVQQDAARRRCVLPVLITIAIFASLSIYCAITSDGFLEADSCTHYLYARLALRSPIHENLHHLVNVWGRPLCTGIYAVPALIGRRLGVGIANYVNIFNPEVVVIGGGVIAAGDLLLEPARAEMAERALRPSKDIVKIVPAHFANEAGMLGAAALAFDGIRGRQSEAAGA
jgi:hypothetical protein